eukprot:TRINITY_DN6719_c0_g1_i4.p1 TRINITY_DN6719_c0_g1~~TRINITY_DN6719_c0_g1_i4.p1  ORF type:complete len:371 (+),score=50.72 TRINITY_DN6719_c0_g1_i4:105-1217(+)
MSPWSGLKVATASGQDVAIDTAFSDGDTVAALRERVAASLGLHPKQCLLAAEGSELEDERSLEDLIEALGRTGGDAAAICAVRAPCRIRPHEYQDYIDRKAAGFLPVDRVGLAHGHSLRFPEGAGETEDFVHSQQLLDASVPDEKEGVQLVKFPAPSGLNVNMMPFEMGNKESLPAYLQQYWPLIQSCRLPRSELGEIGFLTVHESFVPKGQCQRRPGLHIESPGYMGSPGKYNNDRYNWGCGIIVMDWSTVQGGIYMATNVANSCRLWQATISDVGAAAGHLGDMEHMREALGEGVDMEPNRMYWLTDATPHESLPLQADGHRQFFRLVTSSLSAWYPEHSTPNDLVDFKPEKTEIVYGSKFEEKASGE